MADEAAKSPSPTPSFWDTVKSVGLDYTKVVFSPIQSALGQAVANTAVNTQKKVAQVGEKLVSTTSPTSTQSNVTKTSPSIPDAHAQAQTAINSLGMILTLAVGALLFYWVAKRV